jgi:hypothetical protein
MWPMAMGAARLGQIRRGQRRSRPCRGAGRRACSPRARWYSEFGRKDTLRRRTAVPGGDGRGGRDSGEWNTRVGQQAMLGAPRGPMDGARVIGWLERRGTSARRWWRPWRAPRQWWGGSARCAQGRKATLNRCSAVTRWWRQRYHRGTTTSRRARVRRARGSDRRSARCTARVRRDDEGDTCAAKNEPH